MRLKSFSYKGAREYIVTLLNWEGLTESYLVLETVQERA